MDVVSTNPTTSTDPPINSDTSIRKQQVKAPKIWEYMFKNLKRHIEHLFFSLKSSKKKLGEKKKNSEKKFRGLSLIHLQGFAKIRQLVEQGLNTRTGTFGRRWELCGCLLVMSKASWLLVKSSFLQQHTFSEETTKSPPHHCFTPSPAVFQQASQLLFLPFAVRASSCWEICRGKLERGKKMWPNGS